jgi:hypothetical protein
MAALCAQSCTARSTGTRPRRRRTWRRRAATTVPRDSDPQELFLGPNKNSLWRFPIEIWAQVTFLGVGIARAGDYPLHKACSIGKPEVVRSMIQCGAEIDARSGSDGFTVRTLDYGVMV